MDLPGPPPDDALAQPTRAELFGLLGELRRSASTDELAALVGLHPNGVRTHLERLETAGLVARRRVPRPRGRPRDEWSVAPEAAPGGERPRAYGDLARWLARAIPPTEERLGEVERAGREAGRELAPGGGYAGGGEVPATDALRATLTGLGFRPTLERRASGGVCCTLGNCPYRDSVRENREVVCTLHRGLTRGLLDVIAPAAELVAFVPRDPDAAGCALEIDGVPAVAASEAPA